MFSPASSYLGYVPRNSAKPTPASSYQARQVPAPVSRSDFVTPVYKALGNIPIVSSAKDIVTSGKMTPNLSSDSGSGSRSVHSTSSGAGHSTAISAVPLDYLYADLATYYGMSAETAYQEALSNTAYQRSVKDMQAAGLNPAVIYGAGKGSPADGVYSVRSASSGGGGSRGSIRRSSGSSKNNGKLFSTGEFYGLSAAAGLVSAVVSKNPNSYWIGQTVAQGFMTAANSLFRK